MAQDDLQAQNADLAAQATIFNHSGFLSTSYDNNDVPPTSPFSPSNSSVSELELGYSKLWSSGITTDLSYTLRDSETSFPSRPTFSFVSPRLELTLTSSIVQDLFYRRYRHTLERIEKESKAQSMQTKIEMKTILIKSLLDFSLLLDQTEELRLQKELCQKTRGQYQNINNKRKRGSVSRREYLQSLKELTHCQATIERLSRVHIENKQGFEANTNLVFRDYQALDVNDFFSETQSAYKRYKESGRTIDINQQDDVKSLALKVSSLESQQSELKAQTKSPLQLEVKSGFSGQENSLGDAHSSFANTDYPFIFVGLTLDFPLENREAREKAAANFYRLESLKKKKLLVEKQKSFRLSTLEKTLEKDFIIYEKYREAVRLSKDIIQAASRDFNNGRLDFNSLVEFNKALIQDQKTLSNHRIQLIVRVIEYLDFFRFFDEYLK